MRLIDADVLRQDWLENGQNEYVYNTNAVLDSIDAQPTIEAVPLSEIYRVIAGHSDYHGDNILAALTCIAEGKTVNPTKSLEAELVRHGRWVMKNTCGPHTGKLHCSACDENPKSLCAERYCPNCGAKMDLPN